MRVLGLDPFADAQALRPRVGVMLRDGGIPAMARPAELLRTLAAFYLSVRASPPSCWTGWALETCAAPSAASAAASSSA